MLTLKELILCFLKNNIRIVFNCINLKNIILPFYISEQIMNFLDEKNYGIDEEYLEFFNKKNIKLQKVKINGHKIKNSLKLSFLKNHNLEKLELFCLKNFEMNEWIDFIENIYLKELSIRGCLFKKINNTCLNEIVLLKKFSNLIKLDVSCTNFDDLSLKFICFEFIYLKELNISSTFVKNFKFLKNLNNLLIFYSKNMKKCFHYKQIEYLTSLTKLIEIHLDENTFFEFQIDRNLFKSGN